MFEYVARVYEVIDSDTIYVAIDMGFSIQHIVKLKLQGISSSEITAFNSDNNTNRLIELIEGKIIRVVTDNQEDNCGRYLADIYLDEVNINRLLLEENLSQ